MPELLSSLTASVMPVRALTQDLGIHSESLSSQKHPHSTGNAFVDEPIEFGTNMV